MSAILKLKSDGAQALLTAALLAGCALNVMLVWAFAVRADQAQVELARGLPVLVAPVSTGSAVVPARTGGVLGFARQNGPDLAAGGRGYLHRPLRPS